MRNPWNSDNLWIEGEQSASKRVLMYGSALIVGSACVYEALNIAEAEPKLGIPLFIGGMVLAQQGLAEGARHLIEKLNDIF